jgi:hypothetical protein
VVFDGIRSPSGAIFGRRMTDRQFREGARCILGGDRREAGQPPSHRFEEGWVHQGSSRHSAAVKPTAKEGEPNGRKGLYPSGSGIAHM